TVTISDPDSVTITTTVSLDDPAKGTLTNLGGFEESPTGTYTFVGTPAATTTAIRGLTFDPTENRVPVGQTETTTFTIAADDGIAAPVSDNTTTVIATSVNEPPSISGTQAGQMVDDNATIEPFTTVTIGDPDSDTITTTVSLDDPTKGTLSNLGGFVESPAGTYMFIGTPAAVTTAIRGLIFDPTENRVPVGQTETTTFSISADDGIADPVSDDTTTAIVTVVEKIHKIYLPLIFH
ncbi:MAG: hypothetical protein KAI94_08190, partial [Anaerolineales bacterium]|nr:hypothetical protein [Anaerolineales bacterium]